MALKLKFLRDSLITVDKLLLGLQIPVGLACAG